MRSALADVDVLILAGGLGSRLAGVLDNIPKVLAPVDGRPFLDYQLDYLAGEGVRRVVLSLGHRAEMVLAHLAETKSPVRVETVVESHPLGTAGAIAFARSRLGSDPVVVLNGDTWLDLDLAAMLAEHRASPVALATLACVSVDDTRRYGAVELRADGSVARFIEKGDSSSTEGLVNGGVYLLSAQLLDSLASMSGSSLEHDVLPRLPAGTLRSYVVRRANFLDIGTPESYAQAALHLAARNRKPMAAGGA
ncbi:MAG: nucleotidyltransferase family protein [Candidatus Binatus sp.]